MIRTFVDRGGTFTDVVHLDEAGGIRVRKVPSDSAVVGDLSEGELTFGTTVATNALLERKGVRTLLIVNQGLGDLPYIGDMARPELFDPDVQDPPPLDAEILEVRGRLDSEGQEVAALEYPQWPVGPWDAIAIALLHSPRNPQHEIDLAEAARTHYASAGAPPFIALGHQVSPEVGYLRRIDTTLLHASITPVLRASMERDRIPQESKAMRSDGSLCPSRALIAPDAVLSGPAGGVLAVAAVARQAGFKSAVGLDMGGTSTDICRVDGADLPRREEDLRVAGVRLGGRMLEVETIAAGGGSILGTDGLRLFVGPESAGADPGPQCYGRGGPPTLTDAALLAGLIDGSRFDPPLDPDLVRLPGPAEAYLDLARESMAQAVRRVAASRGIDLRDHALVAYGGAAGQHAADVAARLGISTVLIHPCASVLSAFGQSLARREERVSRAIWGRLPDAWGKCIDVFARLCEELPNLGFLSYSAELRYLGTEHAIELPADPSPEGLAAILRAFKEQHTQRYGFDRPGHEVEVVNITLRSIAPALEAPKTRDECWQIGASSLKSGRSKEGPVLLTSPTTSVWVPKGWRAFTKEGLLVLRPSREAEVPIPTERTPYAVELWGNRFMAVAEQSGAMLRRLARSVNIRERLDFSCAVFDSGGNLVANAPHIPVHLGAMGATVRDLIRDIPSPESGQAYVSNHPSYGGSHLPDLTVVTPLDLGPVQVFVASRAHHVDVGGLTPGSMPPDSRKLEDEGFVLRNVPLLELGSVARTLPFLSESRLPKTVRADLEAQIAANQYAASALLDLGEPELILLWMKHLRDVARESVFEVIQKISKGRASDRIADVDLKLAIHREGTILRVDFSGTGGPHDGNLNAPPAVLRAAILYALRVLVGRRIPLNDGALEDVEIEVPESSLLSPPEGAAVVGGNVETSQRLVDLFFRALGIRAASQGTMNNLTMGGPGWSYYETIGGGGGATEKADGQSGRQVHMTNTRVTDAEVLELRFPLRVVQMAFRRGTGGGGLRCGGDGLIREFEALQELKVALLATRREDGAVGLSGGDSGVPGHDSLLRSGIWEPWSGAERTLKPGDRLRICTPGGGGYGSKSSKAEG